MTEQDRARGMSVAPADALTQGEPEQLVYALETRFAAHVEAAAAAVREAERGLEEAQEQVLDHVRSLCPPGARPPLAGNTVATDRGFLARDMPELEAFLHYRIVDVSSIKELARRWFPRAYHQAPVKRGNHRALADIQESIEELRYYREAVFVAPPGPDSETARAVSARHGGALTGRHEDAPPAGGAPDSGGAD